MSVTVHTLPEFEAEAARVVSRLSPKSEGATLVTLSGELGAGKTAFVKAAAAALGVEETITSPTFVLEKIYLLPENKKFSRLVHIDAYRLEGGKELAPLGVDELMRSSDTLVMLEWPEKVRDALPKADHTIAIEALEGGSRAISYA